MPKINTQIHFAFILVAEETGVFRKKLARLIARGVAENDAVLGGLQGDRNFPGCFQACFSPIADKRWRARNGFQRPMVTRMPSSRPGHAVADSGFFPGRTAGPFEAAAWRSQGNKPAFKAAKMTEKRCPGEFQAVGHVCNCKEFLFWILCWQKSLWPLSKVSLVGGSWLCFSATLLRDIIAKNTLLGALSWHASLTHLWDTLAFVGRSCWTILRNALGGDSCLLLALLRGALPSLTLL